MLLIPLLTTALAADTAGRIGIGAEATFTGSSMGQITYWATDKVAAQGALGFTLVDGPTFDSTVLAIGGGALVKLARTEKVDLEFQISAAIAAGDAELVRIQPGIRPEVFVTPDFSFHVSAGLAINFIGDDGFPGFGADTTYVTLGAGGLLGGAGFTFYFPGKKGGGGSPPPQG
ncbi:MAG: hypothetical protein H6736_12565 [Alphaproteobacteria bacterium]|nr:hypothetical protein [Alphaproteobacteria bacterium]MCB9692635.1 hypothetical protein [Alphaproteobacteria bacterium]